MQELDSQENYLEEMMMELREAKRKFKSGEQMSHEKCLMMYARQEMTCIDLCERSTCLREQWHQFLIFMRKTEPRTEDDAEDFLQFIADWVKNPTSEEDF